MQESTERKRADLLKRIESLEEAIEKAKIYLQTGEHSRWSGFRAWFNPKVRNGKELPPHKDWVKNVFLPEKEKALDRAERLLEQFVED